MTCAKGAASSATAASSTTLPSQHHGANAESAGADLKELFSETMQVLKSMMTSGAAGPSRTTTTPEDEPYDTLQRQLDALSCQEGTSGRR